MDRQERERKIRLLDMVWDICLRWRSILICAVVFAILAAGISYLRSSQSISASRAAIQNRTITELDTKSGRRMTTYLQYADFVDKQDEYIENALLMQLDPNDFYMGTLIWYVDNHHKEDSPESDNAAVLISAYQTAYLDNDFLKDALQLTDEQLPYGREVIDFDDTQRVYYTGGRDLREKDTAQEHLLKVYVYAQNEARCDDMLKKLQERTESVKPAIEKELGAHELTPVANTKSRVADGELLAYQKIVVERRSTCQTTMTTMENAFSSAEKQFLADIELEEELQADSSKETAIMEAKPSVSTKLTVVGLILGILAAVFVECVRYLTNTRLLIEDDFEDLYGVKLYGAVIPGQQGKKKWFAFIDSFFLKLRHMNRHYFEETEAVEMVAANIRVWAKQHELKKIYVTGCIMSAEEERVIKTLQRSLDKSGVRLISGKSVLYNAEALEQSVENGCVLLMEQAGKSLYREIREEIEVFERQNVRVMGAVVVG